jgi:uncharacterized protein
MQVTRFRDPHSFLRHAERFLLKAEVENNLMLGVAEMAPAFGDDAYLATVDNGDTVVACAMRTPPYKAVLSRVESRAIASLVADISMKYPDLPEVIGPEPDVVEFGDMWARRTGLPSVQGKRQRLFEIRNTPQFTVQCGGRLRVAEERDLPTIIEWTTAFIAEALPGDPTDPEQHATRRIATRSLFLWDDGRPVSMAGFAGRSARGVRVNYVYTPPACRTRGYATASVATLTQQLLAEGRAFCCLYTDVSNRTSNSIYQKIGYRPICDLSTYVLNSRKAPNIR